MNRRKQQFYREWHQAGLIAWAWIRQAQALARMDDPTDGGPIQF